MYFMYMICTYLLPEKITYQSKKIIAFFYVQFLIERYMYKYAVVTGDMKNWWLQL